DSISRFRVWRAPAPDAVGSLEGANPEAVFADFMPLVAGFRRSEAFTGRRGEISRESTGKYRADHMSASSGPPELSLNSTPWAEALIGGEPVVGSTDDPPEAPGTDKRAAGHSGLPLTT